MGNTAWAKSYQNNEVLLFTFGMQEISKNVVYPKSKIYFISCLWPSVTKFLFYNYCLILRFGHSVINPTAICNFEPQLKQMSPASLNFCEGGKSLPSLWYKYFRPFLNFWMTVSQIKQYELTSPSPQFLSSKSYRHSGGWVGWGDPGPCCPSPCSSPHTCSCPHLKLPPSRCTSFQSLVKRSGGCPGVRRSGTHWRSRRRWDLEAQGTTSMTQGTVWCWAPSQVKPRAPKWFSPCLLWLGKLDISQHMKWQKG